MTALIGRRAALAVGLGCLAMSAGARAGAEGTGPLLVYDVRSAHVPDGPLLRIDRDGTARVRAAPGHAAAVRARLSEAQIAQIIAFLVREAGFLSISDKAIQSEMDRLRASKGRMFQVADAGVTRIELDAPQGRNRVEMYATAMAAMTFPEIEALQRLRKAEVFLLDLVQRLREG